MKIWKKPSKVGYFSKIKEIFITVLAAQMDQKAKYSTTKSLLMQDWVFSPRPWLWSRIEEYVLDYRGPPIVRILCFQGIILLRNPTKQGLILNT